MMTATLEHRGFKVVSAANVTEALKHIATESFDVLLTDLHMPNPGDDFTVVTAMRHSRPDALTLLVSGYPDVQSAMAAILLEADEILVKPFDVGRLADLIREKMIACRPARGLIKKEWARYCSAVLPMSSTTGWSGRNRVENSTRFRSATRSGLDIFRSWLKIWLARPSATTKDTDAVFFRRSHSPWQAAI
jgi:DNA-binding response OmpR family regulator